MRKEVVVILRSGTAKRFREIKRWLGFETDDGVGTVLVWEAYHRMVRERKLNCSKET